MGKFVDLTGHVFGRWTVIERSPENRYGKPAWVCLCDCGTTATVAGSVLRMGESLSCGCYKREVSANNMKVVATTHGMHNTPEYFRWMSMKLRCYCKTHFAYHRYGGRGITVCDRWLHSFENFIADIGERPSTKHSLDRVNNDGNYEPNNVRWATAKEQANNRTKTCCNRSKR